ncbi:hypothetical protein PlfCFBP13513_15015 [Plantibacter flavus]|nr:hypothetical protein PlfCFBP13513_15015 [Plantibacter flavus]
MLVQFNQEIGGPVAPTGSITVALRCVEGSWLFGDGSTREIVVESIQFISGDGIESYDLDPTLCSVAVTEPETPVEPIDTPAIEASMPPAATSAVPAAPPELAETGFGGSSTGLCALTLLAIGGALSVSRLLPVSAAHRMRAQRASV